MASWSAVQPQDAGAGDWAPRGFAGLKDCNPALLRTTGMLQSRGDPNSIRAGSFEVLVSREAPAGSTQLAEDQSPTVWAAHPRRLPRPHYRNRPTMQIERLDHPAPQPLDPAHLSTQLAKSGQLVLAYLELVRSWWQDNLSKRPNSIRFSRALYLSNGGVPGSASWLRDLAQGARSSAWW